MQQNVSLDEVGFGAEQKSKIMSHFRQCFRLQLKYKFEPNSFIPSHYYLESTDTKNIDLPGLWRI